MAQENGSPNISSLQCVYFRRNRIELVGPKAGYELLMCQALKHSIDFFFHWPVHCGHPVLCRQLLSFLNFALAMFFQGGQSGRESEDVCFLFRCEALR